MSNKTKQQQFKKEKENENLGLPIYLTKSSIQD